MAKLQVPVSKGKGVVEFDTETLPDAVFREAMIQGLKVLLNRGMTKIVKGGYASEDAYHEAAMAKAQENAANINAGKIRIMGAKADKASGKAMVEARRIARAMVKDELKKAGVKVSYIEASEITKAANALIAADPTILEKAKAAIAEREAEASQLGSALTDIAKAIPVSEKRKAKAEAEQAKAKALSAAQAGKTKPSKPAGATAH